MAGCQTLPQPDEKESYITAVVDGVRYAAASNSWMLDYSDVCYPNCWVMGTSCRPPIRMSNACLFSNEKVRIDFFLAKKEEGIVLGEKYYFIDGESFDVGHDHLTTAIYIAVPDGNYLEKVSGWVQLDSISNSRAYGKFAFEGKDGEKTISLTDGYFRFFCLSKPLLP